MTTETNAERSDGENRFTYPYRNLIKTLHCVSLYLTTRAFGR